MKRKQFLCFLKVFAYLMGLIGGLGYTIYCDACVIAVAVIILSVMAYPEFKKSLKMLMQ